MNKAIAGWNHAVIGEKKGKNLVTSDRTLVEF